MVKAIEDAAEVLRRLAAEAGIETTISFHAAATPPLLPSLPGRFTFVTCHEGGRHHYCESFDLAGAILIVSREATPDEVERLASCKRGEAKHACARPEKP